MIRETLRFYLTFLDPCLAGKATISGRAGPYCLPETADFGLRPSGLVRNLFGSMVPGMPLSGRRRAEGMPTKQTRCPSVRSVLKASDLPIGQAHCDIHGQITWDLTPIAPRTLWKARIDFFNPRFAPPYIGDNHVF